MNQRLIRVLCVEDDPIQQKLLEHHLRALPDLACTTAFEATESAAWEAFRRQPPGVVLVDYQLAEGDGLSLIRRLRALDPFVPIIAVSGIAPTEVADELIRSGADDYLDKTELDSAGLARSVRAALRRADAFRSKVLSPTSGWDALTDRVRDLYEFLVDSGADALLGHVDAVAATSQKAGGLDQVAAAFDHVCHAPGVIPDVARRILQPYLLEVVTRLSTMPNITK